MKQELLNKAIYIQYPLGYSQYREYNIEEINKLPLPENGMMYDKWAKNTNHFTTEYHRLYSIPLLCKLLKLDYNESDFIFDERNSGDFDISILKPKIEYRYEVYGFTRDEHFEDLSFDDITTNTSINDDITDYHRLYRYSHECSRLINKTIKSKKILFISGDSQMIPDISFLSCFFKEIWYFDNRQKLPLFDKCKKTKFTDVLIELNHLPIEEYVNTNFKSNNIDIFIGTQKTFEPKVTNDAYKIIVGNHEIENNSNLELIDCKHESVLDDKFYSELYMLDYISKNYPLKDYVGFCHYRKYFNFLDNIPNIDETLKQYDAIVAKPLTYKYSVYEQYKKCHNIEDVEIIRNIIHEKFNDYEKAFDVFFKGKLMLPYNMFIMKREDFLEYIEFISKVLNEYLKVVGTDIEKRIEENKDKYLKSFTPNNTVEYQYRIGGYLAERLTNVFMIKKFKRLKPYGVIITENKYGLKKNSI
jgi:hypothetical protein